MSIFSTFLRNLREWPDKDGNDDHGRNHEQAANAHEKAADAHMAAAKLHDANGGKGIDARNEAHAASVVASKETLRANGKSGVARDGGSSNAATSSSHAKFSSERGVLHGIAADHHAAAEHHRDAAAAHTAQADYHRNEKHER